MRLPGADGKKKSPSEDRLDKATMVELVDGGTDFIARVHHVLYPLANNHQDIIDKHIDGHGEQDDTEEFTDNKDKVLA